MIFCWKCKAEQNQPLKLPFRAVCEKCGSDLHVCKQCKHYCPGKPNDCNVPGTDYISDRERTNFCEEFYSKEDKSPNSPIAPTAADIAKRLFKD